VKDPGLMWFMLQTVTCPKLNAAGWPACLLPYITVGNVVMLRMCDCIISGAAEWTWARRGAIRFIKTTP